MVTRLWMCASLIIVVVGALLQPTIAQNPGINLLLRGCSQYQAPNAHDFFDNLNATFRDLTSQLSDGKQFATAQQSGSSSSPVYAMVQCRNYMSKSDCLNCYGAAVAQIRNCSTANGARVMYDGCFLRYESDSFYDQTTEPGNAQICSNRSASAAPAFDAGALKVLNYLQLATPKIRGYYAATTQSTPGGDIVYAIAQCAETTSRNGCQDCLSVAYNNILGCLPNDQGRAVDAGCFMRYSDTAFFPSNQAVNIAPFLRGSSRKKKVIIGGVVGGICLLLLVIALLFWFRATRKSRRAPRGKILGATQLQGPNMFDYKDLRSATNNFSEDTKLGSGGFGDVYKGTLKNGHIVAVKKLDINFTRAKADFETEVRLISNVHHRNLVRLLGCCNKGGQLLLIYEYMANGSLDRFLFGEGRGSLSWKQRYDIIHGTAKGLAYLHEGFHECVIHRDIKPGNILLDDDFQPKIADFGLARLLPDSQTHVTTRFAGTLGYTAPEYAVHGHLSEKVDIYSFGIVILEIISGRRSNNIKDATDTDYLLEEAWKVHQCGMHQKLVDECLDPNEYRVEDLKKLIEIALVCTQSSPSSRPTVSEILFLLLSGHSTEKITTPSRPSFISSDHGRSFVSSSVSSGSTSSIATASFSQFTAR